MNRRRPLRFINHQSQLLNSFEGGNSFASIRCEVELTIGGYSMGYNKWFAARFAMVIAFVLLVSSAPRLCLDAR